MRQIGEHIQLRKDRPLYIDHTHGAENCPDWYDISGRSGQIMDVEEGLRPYFIVLDRPVYTIGGHRVTSTWVTEDWIQE